MQTVFDPVVIYRSLLTIIRETSDFSDEYNLGAFWNLTIINGVL